MKRQEAAKALSTPSAPKAAESQAEKPAAVEPKNLKGDAALTYLGTDGSSCKIIPQLKGKPFSKTQHASVKDELKKDPTLTLEQACLKVKQASRAKAEAEATKPKPATSTAKKPKKKGKKKTGGTKKTRKNLKKNIVK